MAESETISTTTFPPSLSESENSATLPTTKIPKAEEAEAEAESRLGGGISLRIWPPSQNTRDAVVNRLIETLSAESILSKKYEALQHDDASAVAKSIEEEAYGVVSASVVGDDDDGFEILYAYSKEISKLVLESVKACPVASPTPTDAKSTDDVKEEEEEAHVDSVKLERLEFGVLLSL